MPDGKLVMSAAIGGRTALFQVDPGSGEITEVLSGRRWISGFSYDEDFRTVEFVRYPRSNHNLSRTGEPWLLVDRLGRLRDWFTHWLVEE